MNKTNWQTETDKIICNGSDKRRLLLHACCAPCSSASLEYLSQFFDIDVLFYNPNISTEKEFQKRLDELKRFVREYRFIKKIEVIPVDYDHFEFLNKIKGSEFVREGGERCFACYELRLRESAEYALKGNFDYFTTTLSISPLKNAEKLNQIGLSLEKEYGVKYLVSDFKKKNGYKRSTELSKQYGIYRQDYCGCIFSKQERELQIKNKNADC